MKKANMIMLIFSIFLIICLPTISSVEINIEKKSNYSLITENNDANQYALLIGFGAGAVTIAKDAIDMKNLLLKYGWDEQNIKSVLCTEATKNNILNSIEGWLDDREQTDDDVLIYFSIHGGQTDEDGVTTSIDLDEPDNKEEFICPIDFVLRYPYYPFTPFGCDFSLAILDEELNIAISMLESEKILIIFESCFSGGMIDGDLDLAKAGRIVMTSSESTKPSWFNRYGMYGYFTNNLIKGLEGEADKAVNGGNEDGLISAQEAFNYAKPLTTQEVKKKHDAIQTPQIFDGYNNDFNIIDLSKKKGNNAKNNNMITPIGNLFQEFKSIFCTIQHLKVRQSLLYLQVQFQQASPHHTGFH